jgi:tetratricopeptide (TPR) repeat protein
MRFAADVCWTWGSRGLWHDGQAWSEAALAMAPDSFPAERGLLVWGMGFLSAIAGDMQTGIARMLEGQQLLEGAGDLENATYALSFAGTFLGISGDTERAIECLERALALARERGDSVAIHHALGGLSQTEMAVDEYAAARRHAKESLAMAQASGAGYSVAHMTNILGDISRLEGKYEEAREWYERALALVAESTVTAFVPSMRHNLAWAWHGLGDDARARQLFALSVREFLDMDDGRGVAECLIGLGCAAGDPEMSARLFGAGFALLERVGMSLSRPNQRDYERSASTLREVLGEDRWMAAWAGGAELSPEAAVGPVTTGVIT